MDHFLMLFFVLAIGGIIALAASTYVFKNLDTAAYAILALLFLMLGFKVISEWAASSQQSDEYFASSSQEQPKVKAQDPARLGIDPPEDLKGFHYIATVHDVPTLELAQNSIGQFCVDHQASDGKPILCVQVEDTPPVFECGIPDVCLGAFVKTGGEQTKVADTAPSEKLLRISATELNRAWQDNEIAAKQQYEKKRLEVFGTVDQVREGTGPRSANVGLVGTTLFGVVCALRETQWEQAVQLRRGQSIVVRGTCYGDLGNFTGVLLSDCEIVQ